MPSFWGRLFGGKGNASDEILIPSAKVKERNEHGYYKMTCPYCLASFNVWEMPFRATHFGSVAPVSAPKAKASSYASKGSSQRTVEAPASDTPASAMGCFPAETDAKLAAFYQRRNVANLAVLGKVLTLFEPDSADNESKFDGEGIAAVKVYGSNEWVPVTALERHNLRHKAIIRIRDTYGNESQDRLCPHCHNSMSRDAGLYPNYTIMFVGNTYSGKTVYKIRLLYELYQSGMLGNISVKGLSTSGKVDGKDALSIPDLYDQTFGSFYRGSKDAIVDPTQIEYIAPLTFPLTKNGIPVALITFYDFPGEALWKSNQAEYAPFMHEVERRMNELDGIIFLLDTSTVPEIMDAVPDHLLPKKSTMTELDDSVPKTIPQILAVFREKFITADMESQGDGRVNIPFSYVFSKSDYLKVSVEQVRRAVQLEPGSYTYKAMRDVLPFLQNPPVCVTNWEETGLAQKREELQEEGLYSAENWARIRMDYIEQRKNQHTCVDMANILRSHDELMHIFKSKMGQNLAATPRSLLFATSAIGVPVSSNANQAIPEAPSIRLTEPLEYLLWQFGLIDHDETGLDEADKNMLKNLRTK